MVNFYGEYVDIPNVPGELLLSPTEIVDLPEREYHGGMKEHRGNYQGRHKLKKVSPELKLWLIENFPFEIVAYYSVYPILIAPHVDIRPVGYNYFIDTGGDVDTVFYNKVPNVGNTNLWNSINPNNIKYNNLNESEPLVELSRINFELARWVKLQTDIPHGTEGNMIRPRVMITVTQTTHLRVNNIAIAESLKEMIDNW
jgi:hypothetical protein